MTTSRRNTGILRGCLLAVFLSVGLAACGGQSTNPERADSPPGASEATSVKVALFRFQPATLQVPAGTTVTWRNDDAILHTVTAGDPGQPTGDFDEQLADKGATASVTFDKPGTFKYFCARHPEAMRAEVTVTS